MWLRRALRLVLAWARTTCKAAAPPADAAGRTPTTWDDVSMTLRNLALWALIALLLIALFNIFQGPSSSTPYQELKYSELMNQVQGHHVTEVLINSRSGRIDGALDSNEHFYTYAPEGTLQNLVTAMTDAGV